MARSRRPSHNSLKGRRGAPRLSAGAVEPSEFTTDIHLTEQALVLMCHSALEAYVVEHPGPGGPQQHLETYGTLWGYATLPGPGLPPVYTITLASVDTSAERARGTFTPNLASLGLKRDLMTSFWPHIRFLGDFHTHPYTREEASVGLIEKRRLYRFSEADERRLIHHGDLWRRHGYRIGLVITVGQLGRRVPEGARPGPEGTLRVDLGHYRLWIKAYHVTYDPPEPEAGPPRVQVNDQGVRLVCPALTGLSAHSPFGRLRAGRHVGGTIRGGLSGLQRVGQKPL